MNPDSENFESLRRLLALKRHEQPPPGYFDGFSRQVILRIKAGADRQSVVERIFDEVPWVQRLWSALEAKPAFVGTFGVAVCSLLVAGILYSEDTRTPVGPAGSVVVEGPSTFTGNSVGMLAASQPMPVSEGFSSSTNPVASTGGSLFDQVPVPSSQRVSGQGFLLGSP